jgi:hypothetical protein
MAYTKAVRAAALPWNQRRERRAAASTSELDRPAACLNSRPKPRTVSTQFNRLSPSRSMIGGRWLSGPWFVLLLNGRVLGVAMSFGPGRDRAGPVIVFARWVYCLSRRRFEGRKERPHRFIAVYGKIILDRSRARCVHLCEVDETFVVSPRSHFRGPSSHQEAAAWCEG